MSNILQQIQLPVPPRPLVSQAFGDLIAKIVELVRWANQVTLYLQTLLAQFGNQLNNQVQLTPVTFAGLPSTPTAGTILAITDSNTAVWGAAAAGGGANTVLVWWNGASWTVFAK